jgi:hypothetical protein
MRIDEVRRIALSLPEATEEPHFQYASFRIRGKIFATVPPDDEYVHVFVDESQRELMVATRPEFCEKLWWGKKVVGLRVAVSAANAEDVRELLMSAWRRKAPKKLASTLDGE